MLWRHAPPEKRLGITRAGSILIFGLTLLTGVGTMAATLPPYFVEETVGGEWNEACGLTFDETGRIYVWERGGRVWIIETNGVRL